MTHMFTFFKVCKHIYIYIPLPGELLIHDIHVLAQLLALRPRWMINGRICRRSSKSGAARLEGRPSETGSSAVVASWRQHPAIGYCLVKRLGRWLGKWLGMTWRSFKVGECDEDDFSLEDDFQGVDVSLPEGHMKSHGDGTDMETIPSIKWVTHRCLRATKPYSFLTCKYPW